MPRSMEPLNERAAAQKKLPELKIVKAPAETRSRTHEYDLFKEHRAAIAHEVLALDTIEASLGKIMTGKTAVTEAVLNKLVGRLNKLGDTVDTLYAEGDALLASGGARLSSPLRKEFASEKESYEARMDKAFELIHAEQERLARAQRTKKALEVTPELPHEAERATEQALQTIEKNNEEVHALFEELHEAEAQLNEINSKNAPDILRRITTAANRIGDRIDHLNRQNQLALDDAKLNPDAPIRMMVHDAYVQNSARVDETLHAIVAAENVVRTMYEAKPAARENRTLYTIENQHKQFLNEITEFGALETRAIEIISGSNLSSRIDMPLAEQVTELHDLNTQLTEAAQHVQAVFKKMEAGITELDAEQSPLHQALIEEYDTFLKRSGAVIEQLETEIAQLSKLEAAEREQLELASWEFKLQLNDYSKLQDNRAEKEKLVAELRPLAKEITQLEAHGGVSTDDRARLQKQFDAIAGRIDSLFNENENIMRRNGETETGPIWEALQYEHNEYLQLAKNIEQFLRAKPGTAAVSEKNKEIENAHKEILNELTTLQGKIQKQYIEVPNPTAEFAFQEYRDPKTNEVVARDVTGIKRTGSALRAIQQFGKKLFGRQTQDEAQLEADIRTYNNLLIQLRSYEALIEETGRAKSSHDTSIARMSIGERAIPARNVAAKKTEASSETQTSTKSFDEEVWLQTPAREEAAASAEAEERVSGMRGQLVNFMNKYPNIRLEMTDPYTTITTTEAFVNLLKKNGLIDVRRVSNFELWPGEDLTKQVTLFGKFNTNKAIAYLNKFAEHMRRYIEENE